MPLMISFDDVERLERELEECGGASDDEELRARNIFWVLSVTGIFASILALTAIGLVGALLMPDGMGMVLLAVLGIGTVVGSPVLVLQVSRRAACLVLRRAIHRARNRRSILAASTGATTGSVAISVGIERR